MTALRKIQAELERLSHDADEGRIDGHIRRYGRVSWSERVAPPPIAQERTDAFAELLSQGKRMCEAQAALGLTKGEACSTMRRIKSDLGWDQAR